DLFQTASDNLEMGKIKTTKYDAAEYLETPDDMAAHLEACLEIEAMMRLLLRKHWVISRVRKACRRWQKTPGFLAKVSTKRCPANGCRVSTRCLRSSMHLG